MTNLQQWAITTTSYQPLLISCVQKRLSPPAAWCRSASDGLCTGCFNPGAGLAPDCSSEIAAGLGGDQVERGTTRAPFVIKQAVPSPSPCQPILPALNKALMTRTSTMPSCPPSSASLPSLLSTSDTSGCTAELPIGLDTTRRPIFIMQGLFLKQ